MQDLWQETFDHICDLINMLESEPSLVPEYDATNLRKELAFLMHELQRANTKNGFDTLKRSTNFYGKDVWGTPEQIMKLK